MNEEQPLEPDIDGELLIHVTELPKFISVMPTGAEVQTFYSPEQYRREFPVSVRVDSSAWDNFKPAKS